MASFFALQNLQKESASCFLKSQWNVLRDESEIILLRELTLRETPLSETDSARLAS